MNPVFSAALEVQAWLQTQRWRFCIIGGVAVQRWGQPRFTHDVDLTLLTGFGSEEGFIQKLVSHFAPRRPDAADFAVRHRVLLLQTTSGVPVDMALGGLPFEERCVERASAFALPEGHSLVTCSAEDLVVHKCFAGRDRDWADVETILNRQQGKLNLPLVFSELEPLLELKQEPDSARRLRDMISRLENAP